MPRTKPSPPAAAQVIDIRCPFCATDQPFLVMIDLESFSIVDGAVVRKVTGHRLACQNRGCARTFSIGPHGIFHHDPGAIPLSPGGPLQASDMGQDGPPGNQDPGEPPPSLLPLPRRRASV